MSDFEEGVFLVDIKGNNNQMKYIYKVFNNLFTLLFPFSKRSKRLGNNSPALALLAYSHTFSVVLRPRTKLLYPPSQISSVL